MSDILLMAYPKGEGEVARQRTYDYDEGDRPNSVYEDVVDHLVFERTLDDDEGVLGTLLGRVPVTEWVSDAWGGEKIEPLKVGETSNYDYMLVYE